MYAIVIKAKTIADEEGFFYLANGRNIWLTECGLLVLRNPI
jgi:hypothetical protein